MSISHIALIVNMVHSNLVNKIILSLDLSFAKKNQR